MDTSRLKDKSYPNNLDIEEELWSNGYEYIAGLDEAGRGPFAGPVVAAAVVMPKDVRIEKLTDSKKINKKYHEYFAEQVKEKALSYGIGIVSIEEVNDINNIVTVSCLAMKRAIENMEIKPNYLLIDGDKKMKVNVEIPQNNVIKGDYFSHSISCAAIIAKDYRDKIMAELDKKYNNKYNWSKNSGYLVKEHKEALMKYGLTPEHRICWEDVAKPYKKQP